MILCDRVDKAPGTRPSPIPAIAVFLLGVIDEGMLYRSLLSSAKGVVLACIISLRYNPALYVCSMYSAESDDEKIIFVY